MPVKGTVIKALIFTIALSYLIYGLYWFTKSSYWVVQTLINPALYVPPTGFRFINSYSLFAAYLMDYAGFIGLVARVVGGVFAVLTAYLIFQKSSNDFSVIQNKLSKILLCETIYFFSFVPSIFFLLAISALPQLSNYLISAQLFIQILLIPPFLIVLNVKIRKFDQLTDKTSILKWTALLFLSYEIALWVSYLLKWSELFNGAQVTVSSAFAWLLISFRLLSLLNTTVILSLAVVFAVIGTRLLTKDHNSNRANKYWSLSAIFLGAFSIIYVIYCIYLGVLWVIPFGELWMIPFFAVGVYFIVTKTRKTSTVAS